MQRPPDRSPAPELARSAGRGRALVTAAFVVAWLSIVFYPVLLGPVAIVLAVLGARRGDEQRGRRAAVVAACCMVAGFALYAVVLPLAQRDAPQSAAQEVTPEATAGATGETSQEPDPAPAGPPAAPAAATPPDQAAPAAPATLEPSEPFDRATLGLLPPPSDGGEAVTVPVYVAADAGARGRGLMHREDLPDGSGMVFLFPGVQRGGFYMKNTLMPLSIAFYDDDGRIQEILDMEPCTADPCTIYTPGQAYFGALEVEQGWFDTASVEPGWRVELPSGLPTPS